MPDAGEPSRPGVDLIDVQRPKKPKKPKNPKQGVDPFATPKKKKDKKKKNRRGMLQVTARHGHGASGSRSWSDSGRRFRRF